MNLIFVKFCHLITSWLHGQEVKFTMSGGLLYEFGDKHLTLVPKIAHVKYSCYVQRDGVKQRAME